MREGSVGIGWKRVGMLACVIAWIAGITTTGLREVAVHNQDGSRGRANRRQCAAGG